MATKPVECRARVVAVRRLVAEVLEADLDMLEPAELPFDAGQWVSVPFGPKTVRAYSIASTPGSARRLTLCADVAEEDTAKAAATAPAATTVAATTAAATTVRSTTVAPAL